MTRLLRFALLAVFIVSVACDGDDEFRQPEWQRLCIEIGGVRRCESCAGLTTERRDDGPVRLVCSGGGVPTPGPTDTPRVTPTPTPEPPAPTPTPALPATLCLQDPHRPQRCESCSGGLSRQDRDGDGREETVICAIEPTTSCMEGRLNFGGAELLETQAHARNDEGPSSTPAPVSVLADGSYFQCELPTGSTFFRAWDCELQLVAAAELSLSAGFLHHVLPLDGWSPRTNHLLDRCVTGPTLTFGLNTVIPPIEWTEMRWVMAEASEAAVAPDLSDAQWVPYDSPVELTTPDTDGDWWITGQVRSAEGCQPAPGRPGLFRVRQNLPPPPAPVAPEPDGIRPAGDIEFAWSDVRWAERYELHYTQDETFSAFRAEVTRAPDTRMSVPLTPGRWYWRVFTQDDCEQLTESSPIYVLDITEP